LKIIEGHENNGVPVTNREFYPLDEELHQDEAKFFNLFVDIIYI
jgi:hypothetical protein